MKKLLSVLSSTVQGGLRGGFLILALLATTSLWAYDFQSGDLYYNITSDSTVAVTYQEYNSSSNYASIYTVTIPETVTYDGTTYSVTSIGKYAFYDCSSLVSVTIPNSVTHIGDHAFYKTSSLTSVNIPNSVTSIGDYAFRGCSSLTAIDIPNSLTKIVHGMFDDCSSLATVTIPNSVTSIDTWAFSSCTSLTSITIPNSVTRIGSFAFEYCRSLTAITIPESVTDIGSGAFVSCSSLTSVVWNAKKCGQAYNYDGYTYFEIELMDSTNYSYEEIGEFVKYFLDEGNIINNSPFHYCDGIKSFSFGENVEFIPEGLCYGLDGITSITIPESVSSIGERSFGECSSLDTIYCYSKDLPIMYLTDLYVHIVNIEMVYTYDEATPYIYDNTILYVPCQLLDAYKSQEEYTIRFPNIQCLEDTPPSEPQDTTIYHPIEYAIICEGETYVWWGMTYTEADAYTYIKVEEDENYTYHHIYTLELTVIPSETVVLVEEAYDSYEWHGVVYTESGTYFYEEWCFQEILELTIIPSEDNQGEVVVEPSTNSVTITWQKEDDADTYIIVIKQGDKVVCTLIFDAEGNLVSINYLPGRESNKHGIQHAGLTSDSFQYTITGLTPSTDYTYTVTATDDSDNTISSYSGEFTTHHATSVENTNSPSPTIDCQKILYEDHIYILRDGKIYSIIGQEM